MTSSGTAKIQNVTKTADLHIVNFSPATRDHLSNFNMLELKGVDIYRSALLTMTPALYHRKIRELIMQPTIVLKLEDMYGAKIRPPLYLKVCSG